MTAPPTRLTITVVVPDPQREALEAFYQATNGASWTNNGSWLSDQPLGQWHGVTVNGQGQVTHLSLRDNNLSGPLPAALGNLDASASAVPGPQQHQRVSLPYGTGQPVQPDPAGHEPQPASQGRYRQQLGNLSNLSIIGLARNSLSGSLPTSLGNLTGLTKLSLHDNTALSGALPDGLYVNMSGMQRLAVANTALCAPDTPRRSDDWLDTVDNKPGGVPTCE